MSTPTNPPVATASRTPWTAADYEPGQHRHNAEVFIDLSDWHFYGVEEDGLFCVKNSAGVLSFRSLVRMLMRTDAYHHLTVWDAEEAVAQVFHLTPTMRWMTREESERMEQS